MGAKSDPPQMPRRRRRYQNLPLPEERRVRRFRFFSFLRYEELSLGDGIKSFGMAALPLQHIGTEFPLK